MKNICVWTVAGVIGAIALLPGVLPDLRAQVSGGTILGTVRDTHANYQEPKVKIFDNKGNVNRTANKLTTPSLTSEREIQFGLKLIW